LTAIKGYTNVTTTSSTVCCRRLQFKQTHIRS